MVDMKASNANWEDVGYVKRSKNRTKALTLLSSPFMPSELAKKMKISLTHASKIIRELHSRKLIECLNDKLRMGRIYQITEKGKRVLNLVGSDG